ncbi:hypothetical protein [Nocardia sp. NPDC051570]|uniref:hypothetical protein n=1 Tax=Nocardia sp. NPDC051570 TaxID=3364324 RepID=UPI0037932384
MVYASSDLVFNPGDHEAVAGWADAIFVGTVEKHLSTLGRDPNTPETQFRVSVVNQLKGKLPAEVVVNQYGGITSNGDTVIYNRMPLLNAGKTYLFIARFYAEKKWLTIANGVGALELAGRDADAAKLRNLDAEPESVKRMRESIAHQKSFADEATRPKLPDPASLPSEVTGIATPPETPRSTPTPKPSGGVTPTPTTSRQPATTTPGSRSLCHCDGSSYRCHP